MDEETTDDSDKENIDSSASKKGPKRNKTATLKIDATIVIEPDKIPKGAIFKGHRDIVIQDIKFETFNTCYRLARYETTDGSYVSGQLLLYMAVVILEKT
jgi:hypothetical protein